MNPRRLTAWCALVLVAVLTVTLLTAGTRPVARSPWLRAAIGQSLSQAERTDFETLIRDQDSPVLTGADVFSILDIQRINARSLTWLRQAGHGARLAELDTTGIPSYEPSAWRVPLWREIFPRAHKSLTRRQAAASIAAYVAARVSTRAPPGAPRHNIARIWQTGRTDALGLALVTVAALHSVAIEAEVRHETVYVRLGGEWRALPGPGAYYALFPEPPQ
jgi:hypothetical protein